MLLLPYTLPPAGSTLSHDQQQRPSAEIELTQLSESVTLPPSKTCTLLAELSQSNIAQSPKPSFKTTTRRPPPF